jgi:intein/homing endonuclease
MPLKLKLMYNDPDDFNGIEIIEEQNKLGTGNTLYISGPYTGSVKNKNKRIYPEQELERDVQRYINEMVTTKRAMGELNHACSLASSDILTQDGWKSIVDVKVGDLIPTLNRDTGEIEIHPVKVKIAEPHKGKMLRLKGSNLDLTVTPNHRFPVVDRYGKTELVKIEDVAADRKRYSHSYIPKLENEKIDLNVLEIEELYVDEYVYCVSVENETFYIRENDKACWSGNSNAEVNPERACHLVTELSRDGHTWYGKSKILAGEGLPCGNLVKGLINNGVALGISTRSLGTIEESNGENYVRNLHIVAFDCVADPSYPTAFVNGILESKEWIVADSGIYEPVYESLEKSLSKIPKKDVDSYLRQQIIKFIQSI